MICIMKVNFFSVLFILLSYIPNKTSAQFNATGITSLIIGSSHTNEINKQSYTWENRAFDHKIFIENKGQFTEKSVGQLNKINYCAIQNGIKIYYTNKGLVYRADKSRFIQTYSDYTKEEREQSDQQLSNRNKENDKESSQERELMRNVYAHDSSIVSMEWLNANPNAQIIAMEPVMEYFNYNIDNTLEHFVKQCKAYQKLVYKELYPHVDLVYTFHPQYGTKYALSIRPGADISKIKMKYNGDISKLKIDKKGNVIISTSLGDITDHAPLTFYDENKKEIASSFEINDNTVGFKVDKYDSSKDLIIDPWTVPWTLVNPAYIGTISPNKALQIESDAAGNVYVFGSDAYQLQKYNSVGTLLWTYYCFPPNLWLPEGWFGDLAVDFIGNSYLNADGAVSGTIQKIDPSGNMIFSNDLWPNSIANSVEIQRLCFNPARTQLIGGHVMMNHWTIIINTNTGNGVAQAIGGSNQEIRGICNSFTGDYYFKQLQFITKCSSTFAPAWSVLGTTIPYNSPAYYGPLSFGKPTPGGQNCIAASKCYVYYFDGSLLEKRSAANGALLASITVTGGTTGQNSGVLVDSCDNIYVGTSNSVKKYDVSLSLIATVATSGAVYDLTFSTNSTVLACGNGFVSSISGLRNPCIYTPLGLTVNTTGAGCNTVTGSATANPSAGTTPYSYNWSNGQTTQSATGLAAGTYTVTVSDNSCFPKAITQVINIVSGAGITAIVTSTNTYCANTGTATASTVGGVGPYTYSWSNGMTNQTTTGLGAGTHTVTVIDANGCKYNTSVQVIQNLPNTPTITVTSPPDITCTNPTTTIIASSTTPNATFTWSYPTNITPQPIIIGANTSSPTVNQGGLYKLIVTDPATGCTATTFVLVDGGTYVAAANAGPSKLITCTTTTVTLNGTPASGGWTYSWAGPGIVSGANTATPAINAPGTYTFTVTNPYNLCTSTSTVIVTANPTVSISIAPNQIACNGNNSGSASALATNGIPPYTYSWSNSLTTQTISGLSQGNYSVTVTDNNGCISTATVQITAPTPIISQFAKGTTNCANCGCKEWLMINATGGTSPYSYSWPDGNINRYKNQLCPGNYAINITDKNGCSIHVDVSAP